MKVRGRRCPSHQCVEYLHKARLVNITHGRLAIGLDPFGMLDPEIVVNLLLQLAIGVNLRRHGSSLIWNVHLYSPSLL
jgi:hypothetical protein